MATAPGKIVVMGEHAAIYGCPAIVATFGLYCRVTAERILAEGVWLDLPDLGEQRHETWADIEQYARVARERWMEYVRRPTSDAFGRLRGSDPAHLIMVALGEAACCLGSRRSSGLRLQVNSQIPLGAGFGSSAAAATAVVGAVLSLYAGTPSIDTMRSVVLEVERRQHGQPSGIDHNCVLLGGMAMAARDTAGALAFTPLAIGAAAIDNLAIYDTGPSPEATGAVVTAVRERLADSGVRAQLLSRMERNTLHMRQWLEGSGGIEPVDVIRDYQSCLEKIGVVPEPVKRIIRAVEAVGGAAKISGAGSLTGPGAGALLVYWRDRPPVNMPDALIRLPRLFAPLAVAGFSVVDI